MPKSVKIWQKTLSFRTWWERSDLTRWEGSHLPRWDLYKIYNAAYSSIEYNDWYCLFMLLYCYGIGIGWRRQVLLIFDGMGVYKCYKRSIFMKLRQFQPAGRVEYICWKKYGKNLTFHYVFRKLIRCSRSLTIKQLDIRHMHLWSIL